MSEAAVDAAAFNAFEAAGWESKAAGYDEFFGRITGRLLGPLLDGAEVGSGSRVLDVATLAGAAGHWRIRARPGWPYPFLKEHGVACRVARLRRQRSPY